MDTNIAILVRDENRAIRQRLVEKGEPLAISLVTLIALEGGVATHAAVAAQRRRAVDILIREVDIIVLDRRVASAYRDIVAAIGFSRRKILDRLIAATALVHDLTLVTTNGDDFRDVPALRLDVWPALNNPG